MRSITCDGILFTMRMKDLSTLSFNSAPACWPRMPTPNDDLDPLLKRSSRTGRCATSGRATLTAMDRERAMIGAPRSDKRENDQMTRTSCHA